MRNAYEPECVWALGAEVAEAAHWSPSERAIYFVDANAPLIHRLAADGRRASWPAPSTLGFLAARRGGGLICGLRDGVYGFDPATGAFALVAPVEPDQPANRINDGYVQANGRIWFGTVRDPGTEEWSVDAAGNIVGLERDPLEEAPGILYSLEPNGELTVRDTGYAVTNGPAMSPDGRTLFHADSLARRIYAFDVGPDGALSQKRVFVEFAPGEFPDGMAVDEAGDLWVAVFNGWRVEQYAPSGEKRREVRLPCANPTKPAFGGEDLRTLYVTTARVGLSPEALEAQAQAGGLFAFQVEVAGCPTSEAP